MPDSGVVIKVHSGSDVIYSTSKPVVENTAQGHQNAAFLVKSLREAKAEVNQFLTEMVLNSGDQGQNKGAAEGSDDEQDEDDEDEDGGDRGKATFLKGSVNTKRKLENRIDTENGSKMKRSER